ncbi:hypothetical protein BS50DRAFT_138050 [Corynespora cassiicola Philippines]|uniref:Uncharacterized protein n=1 Tax=Corynespora cassiicola Philippines TaxID=1448308 RepID=A0A2T2N9P0_CORCC|nr:hypothetical protein BS50DRAFT_138050 [Corynespora cassiicola Philippines]
MEIQCQDAFLSFLEIWGLVPQKRQLHDNIRVQHFFTDLSAGNYNPIFDIFHQHRMARPAGNLNLPKIAKSQEHNQRQQRASFISWSSEASIQPRTTFRDIPTMPPSKTDFELTLPMQQDGSYPDLSVRAETLYTPLTSLNSKAENIQQPKHPKP